MKEERLFHEKQGEDRHSETRTQGSYGRRAKEDTVLLEASFEPANEYDLWVKNGVFYGREAALQKASRQLREGGKTKLFYDT